MYNNHLSNYLDYYLSSDERSAVLIMGEWGSGKTHFIKNYLDGRDNAARKNDPLEGQSYLYASLNGVSKVSAISDQFFAQLNPVLSSTAARLIGAAGSSVLQGYSGVSLFGGGLSRISKELLSRTKNQILVFDDLERCELSAEEMMGYINHYIEHEKLKVILLAEEKKLSKKYPNYLEIKEKVVGKTIQFDPDVSSLVVSIIKSIPRNEMTDFYLENCDGISNCLRKSEILNFRSLRSILMDFERVSSLLDEKVRCSNNALREILLYMISVGLEFRANNITKENILDMARGFGFHSYSFMRKNGESKEKSGIEKLFDKHDNFDYINPILPHEIISDILENGQFDCEKLNSHLLVHPSVVEKKAVPIWRRLWSFYNLDRKEYEELIQETLSSFINKEIRSPGPLLLAAGSIIEIEEMGGNVTSPYQSVIKFFENHVRKLLEDREFQYCDETFGIGGGTGFAGLGFRSENSDSFIAIYALVRSANSDALRRSMREFAQSYVDSFLRSEGKYEVLHACDFTNQKYGNIAFLQFIDPKMFAHSIVENEKADKRLLAALSNRYQNAQGHDTCSLHDEREWLLYFLDELLLIADAAKPPHRNMLKHQISSLFSTISKCIGLSFLALRDAT
ncbi:P-loop NTPase fold protein [Thalassospira alkalitolerans]|uniref:P-loop NTPase fold protein n=1 Tax=Thalassospira alkalitolerans TaxID=1293890 RepID=UPI003AA9A390